MLNVQKPIQPSPLKENEILARKGIRRFHQTPEVAWLRQQVEDLIPSGSRVVFFARRKEGKHPIGGISYDGTINYSIQHGLLLASVACELKKRGVSFSEKTGEARSVERTVRKNFTFEIRLEQYASKKYS